MPPQRPHLGNVGLSLSELFVDEVENHEMLLGIMDDRPYQQNQEPAVATLALLYQILIFIDRLFFRLDKIRRQSQQFVLFLLRDRAEFRQARATAHDPGEVRLELRRYGAH